MKNNYLAFDKIRIFKHKLKLERFYYMIFFCFLLIGLAFNFIAIFANDYKMPVLSNKEFNNPLHFSYYNVEDVKLWILTDIIPIGEKTFSIGDFILISSISFLTLITISIIYYNNQIIRILKETAETNLNHRRKI